MGVISPPPAVKAILGLLFKDAGAIGEALRLIEGRFGPIDYRSPCFPFVETGYYSEEMGENLTRQYVSLERLIHPDELPLLKTVSNQCEERFSIDGRRAVNLDPGYIGAANLILASTKNFSQRIYLSQGIYAEVTMTFQHGDFHKLPWTYPDYYNHRDVFCEIRRIYRRQLQELEEAESS
ncbi:MAG: DUF4416 family protein [Candidatus Omnitrophica bacterium]|nr:DUF4416 family protein [Candidatus Omnitrophota bacterium]